MKKYYKGFTLVELIIVITILAILATISFIGFAGYIKNAKSTQKTVNLKNIEKGLDLFNINTGKYPLPDNNKEITFNGKDGWYIGIIGNNISKNILSNNEIIDTEYNVPFSYGLVKNKRDEYEVGGIISNDNLSLIDNGKTYASNQYTYLVGNYNGKYIKSRNVDIITPGLLLSDDSNTNITDNDELNIATNKSLNIPYSYSGAGIKSIGNKTAVKEGSKKLAIFYGWPNSLNHQTNGRDNDLVIQDFNQYDTIVLGAGLEQTSHGDHANTQYILDGYIGDAFGYITIKQSYSNIISKVDLWDAMGIDGIFLDEDGYDYLVDGGLFSTQIEARDHQNSVYDYIHSKGLKIIANGWVPSDIFGQEYGEAETTLNLSTDGYLFESFVYNVLSNPIYDYDNQIDKLNSILDYQKDYNFDFYCVGMQKNLADITDDMVKTFYDLSRGYCNYIQITDSRFGSMNPDSDKLINYFKNY